MQVGDYKVDDHGISQVEQIIDGKFHITKLIMPKEVFIEAYNKYIKGENKE